MTPEEITRTIAEWMGYPRLYGKWYAAAGSYVEDLTTSLDALQPVLAKFTPEMRILLAEKVWDNDSGKTHNEYVFLILTLPAQTLARLVAETIKESAKR